MSNLMSNRTVVAPYAVSGRAFSFTPVVKKKKPNFGGMFTVDGKQVYITKVIYNDPVTIVFWSDGKKNTARCDKADTYNKEVGLMLCVMKRMVGGEQVSMLFKDWVTEDKVVDLKKVRENQKVKVEAKEEVKEQNA